jgi:hypothetical protein
MSVAFSLVQASSLKYVRQTNKQETTDSQFINEFIPTIYFGFNNEPWIIVSHAVHMN